MSECTHNCNTCGGGCHFEVEEGHKPKDILKEIQEFVIQSDTKEMSDKFDELAKALESEI